MGRCLIFCAGEFDALVTPVEPDDYVIAADGGLAHTQRLGLTADVILGDFDSLGYVPEGEYQVAMIDKSERVYRMVSQEDVPALAQAMASAYAEAPWHEQWSQQRAEIRVKAILSGWQAMTS